MKPAEVFNLLGLNTTFLRIAPGQKRPIAKEWQKLRPSQMTQDYLATFAAGEGIGVSLGEASWSSEWDLLFSLDIDHDDYFLKMLELNPFFAETLQTNGARGGNVWFYIRGFAPPSSVLVLEDGSKFGEWRGTGNQTIITGTHPCGKSYTNNGKRPQTISAADIKWPTNLKKQWLPQEPKEEPEPTPEPLWQIHARLHKKCGAGLYTVSTRGRITLNQNYIVQYFCCRIDIIFEQHERQFYVYNKNTGAWHITQRGTVKETVRRFWEGVIVEFKCPEFAMMATDHFLNAIVSGIESHAGRTGVFKRPLGIIHCKNAMLHLTASGEVTLKPFSPDYYSRNPIGINFNPEATCPRFRGELLDFALPAGRCQACASLFRQHLDGRKSRRANFTVGRQFAYREITPLPFNVQAFVTD
jgi:hypothetical protein